MVCRTWEVPHWVEDRPCTGGDEPVATVVVMDEDVAKVVAEMSWWSRVERDVKEEHFALTVAGHVT